MKYNSIERLLDQCGLGTMEEVMQTIDCQVDCEDAGKIVQFAKTVIKSAMRDKKCAKTHKDKERKEIEKIAIAKGMNS